eukprot:3593813-Rhodomonas_salina.1
MDFTLPVSFALSLPLGKYKDATINYCMKQLRVCTVQLRTPFNQPCQGPSRAGQKCAVVSGTEYKRMELHRDAKRPKH